MGKDVDERGGREKEEADEKEEQDYKEEEKWRKKTGDGETSRSSTLRAEQHTPFNKPYHLQIRPKSNHSYESGNLECGSQDLRFSSMTTLPCPLFTCPVLIGWDAIPHKVQKDNLK